MVLLYRLFAAVEERLVGWTTREPDKVERLKSVTQQVALAASGVCGVTCCDRHNTLLVSGGQDVHVGTNGRCVFGVGYFHRLVRYRVCTTTCIPDVGCTRKIVILYLSR